MSCRKTHQSAAWAIWAAIAVSFFNRASLIWLCQLRDRLPSEDARIHQDVTKLIAAAEFSADASLDVAKFASRALASSVVSRHLLWLRHWRADTKSKWRLTAAPFKGSSLFGVALDPVLVEGRDKRKILSTSYRRPDRRPSPYGRQPFRADSGPSGSYFNRNSGQGYFSSSGRSTFRDRGRHQTSFRRPFCGTGSQSFR